MFMVGAGTAAEGYLAFKWPSNWGQGNADYHRGYAAGVMDTVTYIHQVGVSGANLNAARVCTGTKGLTDQMVSQTVDALLASNPKFDDTVAAAVMVTLQTCKMTAPTGNVVNLGNRLVKR